MSHVHRTSPSDTSCSVVNGGNGFFGYGYCSCSDLSPRKHGETATWWSTHSLNECPDDWRQIDLERVRSDLKRRHSGWKDPTVQNIVRDVEVDSLYPTFTTPLLPTWHEGGCVLVGDAAHALQPSSGQVCVVGRSSNGRSLIVIGSEYGFGGL